MLCDFIPGGLTPRAYAAKCIQADSEQRQRLLAALEDDVRVWIRGYLVIAFVHAPNRRQARRRLGLKDE